MIGTKLLLLQRAKSVRAAGKQKRSPSQHYLAFDWELFERLHLMSSLL